MNTTTRDKALTTINVIVWIFLIGAALISLSHIVHTAQMLGLGWEAYTVPAFVDGIAIVGKVSMLPRFSETFRKSGFKLLMFGGILSLAANVAAGNNWGERAFGVLVVAGFMILESHATKGTRTVAVAAPEVDEVLAAKRRNAALKGAEKRRDNKAKAEADAEAKRQARRDRAAAKKLEALAPTSPGHPAVLLSASDKAVLAEYMPA